MESIVTDGRYQFIQKIVGTTVKKAKEKLTTSDKIDRIVTNRILGIPIFIAVMWLVYYISVTTVGTFVTDWTNDTFVGAIQEAVGGFLTSLRTAVTWFVSHSSWTVCSDISDFQARALFRF